MPLSPQFTERAAGERPRERPQAARSNGAGGISEKYQGRRYLTAPALARWRK